MHQKRSIKEISIKTNITHKFILLNKKHVSPKHFAKLDTVFRDHVENQDSVVREDKTAPQDRQAHPDSVVNKDRRVQLDLRDHPDLVENLDHREPQETVVRMDNRDKTDREAKTVGVELRC